MTKGSKGSGKSGSKTVATTGYVSSVPVKSTVSFKGSGRGERSYQTTSRVSYGDKQNGCYGRATTKEKASAGEFHWKNGTTGTRSEYTQSSTVRVGDKRGYTEVYNEQRVRNVSYNKSGSKSNQITYNNDDNGGYGSDSDDGCDYESDSDEGGDYDSENEEDCDYDSENDEGGDYDSDNGDGGDYDNDSDNGDGGDYDDSDIDDGGSDGYDFDY